MKQLIKKILPSRVIATIKTRVLTPLEVRREYHADRQRYLRHMVRDRALSPRHLNPVNLEAQLTKDYHAIEKGMSLPAVKRPFGTGAVERIDALLPAAGKESAYVRDTLDARAALDEWNRDGRLSDQLAPVIEPASRGLSDPEAFFNTRHSVRNFSAEVTSVDELDRAVSLALQTPSVCNRQSWRVRFYQGADIHRVLQFQNGNAGFRETISTVALVTVDARFFTGVIERNQPWIDGGLFAMSLVWALHAIDLDSCLLNLSVVNATAARMRDELGLEDSELPITMIAIGRSAAGSRRTRSPRKRLDEVRRY